MQILCIYLQNASFPVLLLLAKIASMLVRFVSLSFFLSVCLSVNSVQVTAFYQSSSNFYCLLEMRTAGNLSILNIIRIIFWTQDSFFTFFNMG